LCAGRITVDAREKDNRSYDALHVKVVATMRALYIRRAPVMNERGSRKYVIVPSAVISSLKPLSTSGSARSVLSLCRLFVFSNLTMPTLMHASTNYISEHISIRGRTIHFAVRCGSLVLFTQKVTRTNELFTKQFKNYFHFWRPAHFYGITRELAVL
jgi:hypothetical protein